jgi:hypothetical protein
MPATLRPPLALAAIAFAAFAPAAFAQTPPTGAPAETKPAEPAAPPPIFSIGGFDLTGHFDVGYSHLSGSGKFVSGANDRVFDFKHNAAAFHSLDLQLAKTPDEGFGGVLDLTIGKDADTIAAYGTISKSKGPANGANQYIDATQAYFHFGIAPVTIIAGKYVTLAGAEYIKSDADTNYSRSILFGYAIPFTHTGVRATWKLNDDVSLIAGVNQGWDQLQDTNSDKTVELGGTFAFSKAVSLAAAVYTGKETLSIYPVVSRAKGTRTLVDLLGTFNATDQLSFIVNYDYGSQESGTAGLGKAKWQGVAGYVNYQLADQWRVSLRAEYFDDKDGYRTGIAQKWKEATLTLAYLPAKEWEIRGEVRTDHSDQAAFLKSDGSTPTDRQNSFGLEVLYKF